MPSDPTADAPADADPDDESNAGDDDTEDGSLLVTERDTPKGLLVSVCDADLLGETFENGDISLTVTEEFYGGDHRDVAGAQDALTRASVANLVGVRAVTLAVEVGVVDERNVLEVGETVHAQFLRM
jgi:hypothetical protein